VILCIYFDFVLFSCFLLTLLVELFYFCTEQQQCRPLADWQIVQDDVYHKCPICLIHIHVMRKHELRNKITIFLNRNACYLWSYMTTIMEIRFFNHFFMLVDVALKIHTWVLLLFYCMFYWVAKWLYILWGNKSICLTCS
jgi:hypothetical protein